MYFAHRWKRPSARCELGSGDSYCDRKIGRVERWHSIPAKVADLRIDSAILNSVCFLVVKPYTGEPKFAGTAFFLSLASGSIEGRHLYLVTARHVVKQARVRGEVYARLNVRGGGTRDYKVTDDWTCADDADLAIAPAPAVDDADVEAEVIYGESLLTDAHASEHDLGVGDDVAVTGLYGQHVGEARNAPIVRSGTIAAMPNEPVVVDGDSAYPGYLDEMRSVAGLSGSPVFVVFGYERPAVRKFEQPSTSYLLGVMRAHWDYKLALTSTTDETKAELVRINQGIAVVTPSQALTRLLDRPDFVRKRHALEDEVKALRAANPESADDLPAAGSAPERLKPDDCKAAADKLMRTPRPDGDRPKPAGRKRRPKS